MTNAEIKLDVAVKALENNELSGSSRDFIESIKDYDKKQLRTLSAKQYEFLNDIYKKFNTKY